MTFSQGGKDETQYLKKFFTKPLEGMYAGTKTFIERKEELENGILVGWLFLVLGLICIAIGIGFIIVPIVIYWIYTKREELKKLEEEQLKKEEWGKMSPEPLFSRLNAMETLVAESSYQNLGIIKDAKPSEGGIIRPPAYCYGPHFSFEDFIKIDETGEGKGASYAKYCTSPENEGWYSRKYDMMVVQFTATQLLVYKCVFDCLEMTKTMEESYEWNYKHVVGINIMGDEEEKDVGGGFSLSGTKYLTISAASGDKIRIVLGAGTKQLEKQHGHKDRTKTASIGGEERIFAVANAATKNIREAIRAKAH